MGLFSEPINAQEELDSNILTVEEIRKTLLFQWAIMGVQLKCYRKLKNISVKELSQEIGINEYTLKKILYTMDIILVKNEACGYMPNDENRFKVIDFLRKKKLYEKFM